MSSQSTEQLSVGLCSEVREGGGTCVCFGNKMEISGIVANSICLWMLWERDYKRKGEHRAERNLEDDVLIRCQCLESLVLSGRSLPCKACFLLDKEGSWSNQQRLNLSCSLLFSLSITEPV